MINNFNYFVFLGAVCMVCMNVWGSEIRYPVYKIQNPTSETEWESLPSGTDFFVYGKPECLCSKQTYFYIVWNEKSLFFKILCIEPDSDKLNPGAQDGGALWNEDSIEIFIKPGKNEKAVDIQQFIINPAGARYWHGNIGKESQIRASGKILKGSWEIYFEIPFEILGKKPVPGEKWHFNIVRNNLTRKSSDERLSCWSPVISSLRGEIDNCACMVFQDETFRQDKIGERSHEIRTNHIKDIINKIIEDEYLCRSFLNEDKNVFGDPRRKLLSEKFASYDKILKTGNWDADTITAIQKELSGIKDEMLKELLGDLVNSQKY